MEYFDEKLLNLLPESKTKLDDKTKQKIYRIMPVPNDYTILWADIDKFVGNPTGIVVCKEALIIKIKTKKSKKTENKENDGTNDEIKKDNIVNDYMIINWRNINLDELTFSDDGNKDTVKLMFNNIDLCSLSKDNLNSMIKHFNKRLDDSFQLLDESFKNKVDGQTFKNIIFNLNWNQHNSTSGHGFYAEGIDVFDFKLKGLKPSHVGVDNKKDGVDILITEKGKTQFIQCKYCANPKRTIDSCFKINDGKRTFRYWVKGKPMQIEVAKDQYYEAVELMENEIRNNHVRNVHDPKMATNIIRKGNYTTKQVRNFAKAGNCDSLMYDIKTNSVNCLSSAGVSYVINVSRSLASGQDIKDAAIDGVVPFICTAGKTGIRSVAENQLARTKVVDALGKKSAKGLVSRMPKKLKDAFVNNPRKMVGDKKIYGAALDKKALSNIKGGAIVAVATFAVDSSINGYKYVNKEISGRQVIKNESSTIGGLVGGAAGLAGSAFIPNKNIKKFAAPVLATAGAMAGSYVTDFVGDVIYEDDKVKEQRLIKSLLNNFIIDNLLDTDEIVMQKLVDTFINDDVTSEDIRLEFRKSKNQSKYFEEKADKILKSIRNGEEYTPVKLTNKIYKKCEKLLLKVVKKGELKNEM